jgi:hypothetical protein
MVDIKRGMRIRYGVRELHVLRVVKIAGGVEYRGTDPSGKKATITVPLWDTPQILAVS